MPTRNPFSDDDSSDDDLQMSLMDMEAGGSGGFASQTGGKEEDFKRVIELSHLAKPEVLKTTFKDDFSSVEVKDDQLIIEISDDDDSMMEAAGGSAGCASQTEGEVEDIKRVIELSLLSQPEVVKITFKDEMSSVKVKEEQSDEDDSMFTDNSFAQPLVDRLTNSERGMKLVLEKNLTLREAVEISKCTMHGIRSKLAKDGWEWDDFQGVWKSNRQPGVTSQGAPRLGFGSGLRPKQNYNSGWEDEKLGFWLDDVVSGAKTLRELEVEEGIKGDTMSLYLSAWGWIWNHSTKIWERYDKAEKKQRQTLAQDDCLKVALEVITGNRDIKEVSQENRRQVRDKIRGMGYKYSFRNGWVKK